MKLKILLAIIAIIAILTVVVIKNESTKSEINPISILPESTLVMIEANDLSDELDFWKKSSLVTKLSKIDIASVMKKTKASTTEIKIYNDFCKDAKDILNPTTIEALKTLFGEKIVVALLDAKFNPKVENPDTELKRVLGNIVIISQPTVNGIVLSVLENLVNDLEKSTETYKNSEIKTIIIEEKENIKLSYTFFNGLFIASISQDTVKKLIDNSLNNSFNSLADKKEYIKTKEKLYNDYDGLGYINISEIYTQIKSSAMIAIKDTHIEKELSSQLKIYDDVYSNLGIGMSSSKRVGLEIKEKYIVNYSPEKMEEYILDAYKLNPLADDALKIIPEKTLLSAISSVNMKAFIDLILKSSGDISLEQISIPFKQFSGVDFTLFIDSLGNFYGLTLNDIKTGGIYPAPQLNVFIEVKNKDVVNQVINNLLKQVPMPLSVENYNEAELSFVTLPPMMGGIQPGYGFYNNNLIISSDIIGIKQMVDAKTGNKNLSKDKYFAGEKTGALVLELENILLKASNILSSYTKKIAEEKDIILINELALPIIDAFKMIKSVKVKSKINDNVIESEIITKLNK